MKTTISIKPEDAPKRRSGLVVAMRKRHGRKQVMRDRRNRRSKDARKSWRREEW